MKEQLIEAIRNIVACACAGDRDSLSNAIVEAKELADQAVFEPNAFDFTVFDDIDDKPDCETNLKITITDEGIIAGVEDEEGQVRRSWAITAQDIADELCVPIPTDN